MAAFAPFYRAVQLGPVPLVAGLGATEGGVAAAIAFATGERLPALTLLGLVIALGGMVFVLDVGAHAGADGARASAQAGLLATLAAIALRALAVSRARARSTTCPSSGCPPAAARSAPCCRAAAAAARQAAAAGALPALHVLLRARAVDRLLRVPRRRRLERRLGARRARVAGLGGRHGDLVPRPRRAALAAASWPASRCSSPASRSWRRRAEAPVIGVLLATFTACTWGSISVLEARVSRALGGAERAGLDLRRRARRHAADRAHPRRPGRERGRLGVGDGWPRSARWSGSR